MSHIRSPLRTLCMLAALCAAATTATAQTAVLAASGPASGQARGNLAAADRGFVTKAAQSGLAEVTLGRLAAERAADAQVKDFGNMMVSDHGKANEELARLATAKGLSLPTKLDAAHQREADQLAKQSGAAFDRAFMTHMVKAHKTAVADFEKASKTAQDAELKDFATRTLPTLQTHLQQAQRTLDSLKAAAPAGGASR
jgi:putative membrane protein